MRSLISIILRLWLLYLSLRYTSFQHFNVSVREICHCVLPQNGVMVKVALIFHKGFLFRLIPNCAMLPGRKEKRLLHFKFHAAGTAKGSSIFILQTVLLYVLSVAFAYCRIISFTSASSRSNSLAIAATLILSR